jgi:hypothetical protein
MPDEHIESQEPRPPRRPPRDANGDEFDDRPRRRSRRDDDEVTEDATGGLIPYKNPKALISYYTGILSLLPVLGLVLGPIALILGVAGLRYVSAHPKARGTAHAIVGIILGTLATLGNFSCMIIFLLMPHGWGR